MTSDPVSADWYATFFTELPNEFWRRAIPPEATAAEIDFVERHLGLATPSRVLDVPCGSGRHSLALATRGHRVTGLDISAEAIAYGRKAAVAAGVEVELIQADMREAPTDGSYDAAVCLGNSFGYLDIPGIRAFTTALAGALRPGGGLVIDFAATAESVLPTFTGEPDTMVLGDITLRSTNSYDVVNSRLIGHDHFVRGDEELTATSVHYVYTSAHIGQMLADAGFVDVQRYGGTGDEPFVLGPGRLLLTARRG